MIINKCVEQGIYVISILALEKNHKPLKSTELSSILYVSDSYLKKILRKLVLANLIVSNAGKDGGFILARNIKDITVYDVYSALEGEECEIKTSGIGRRIFVDDELFTKSEAAVTSSFQRANKAFSDVLKKITFADLVQKQNAKNGLVKFEDLAKSVIN